MLDGERQCRICHEWQLLDACDMHEFRDDDGKIVVKQKTKSVGLIGMSAKPLHIGHWNLITRASEECDEVKLFVSLADRGGKEGEALVTGKLMDAVWQKHIMQHLPVNVTIEFGGSPVRKMYEYLGQANELKSSDVFRLYADDVDNAKRFPVSKQIQYFGHLSTHGLIKLVSIERSGDNAVSATMMRLMLASGDHDGFVACLPDIFDRGAIWSILHA